MSLPPTAADVRGWSKVDFSDSEIGYPPPSGGASDSLQFVVDQAVAYVAQVTARNVDGTMPTVLVPVAQAAVLRRTEQLVQMSREDNVETAGEVDLVQSFSAGAYEETRRDTSSKQNGPSTLNPWPELERILWLLLTETPDEIAAGGNPTVSDRRDYWRWILGQGSQLPAWETVEVDWSRSGDVFTYAGIYPRYF